jgi:transposase-like protein
VVVESIVAGRAVEPEIRMQLDAIAREGARRMLAAALRAEVAEYLGAAEGDRDEQGHALVTRNGTARPREVVTVAGSMPGRRRQSWSPPLRRPGGW